MSDNTIVYISNEWRGENKTSSHQIAERLAKKNKILYVEAAGLRAPRVSGRDFKKILTKLRKGLSYPRKVKDNIFVVSPLIIPLHRFEIIQKLNKLLAIWSIKRACRKLKIAKPILWIFLPHYSNVIGTLGEKLLVYYCVDEYSDLPGVDSEKIKEFEKKILEKADITFAVSNDLATRKKTRANNVFFSPHGVDFDHFFKGSIKQEQFPSDLVNISQPIIGFIGLIESWVDIDLLEYLAKERPNYKFVFIGKVLIDVAILSSFSNVHFLGWKSYEEVPTYLSCFDVTTIPFRLNQLILSSNPLKLKEYLAAGKPVITTKIPAAEEYSDYIYIGGDQQQFLACIDRALNENSQELIKQRIDAMRSESWDARVLEIERQIDNLL